MEVRQLLEAPPVRRRFLFCQWLDHCGDGKSGYQVCLDHKPDSQHYKITINVQDLTSLIVPPTLGAPMRSGWRGGKLPIRTSRSYLLRRDGVGWWTTATFFDGETSSINTSHGKFLTYPPGHTIQGGYTATSPGSSRSRFRLQM